MDWARLTKIIRAEHDSAVNVIVQIKPPAPDEELNPIKWIEDEIKHRKTVNMAIRYWIAHRRHAGVEKDVARYLALRFTMAANFLDMMKSVRPDFKAPEKRVLNWLLVTYWNTSGRAIWIQNFLGPN